MTLRIACRLGVWALIAFTCGGCKSHKDSPAPATEAVVPADDGWRRDFTVNKADLGPAGANPYLNLSPGVKYVFRDGKTTLTIRVLQETRVVDGVTTRVVEEREEEGGRPKEVSRNYFAIDRILGDVYYFGEDVDEYANGTVTHPGVWHSGVNGAHFGLMMPAHPRVGDRFYQELSPGIAMDRFEILSVDETIKTPAGTFDHCVHIRETSPLSTDVGHKWFAPRIGLVLDGDAELVSSGAGAP